MKVNSIWEDVYYTVTGQTTFDYNIYKEGTELVYSGRAVANPNKAEINIGISRIVQNYLNSDLPSSVFNYDDFNTGTFFLDDATHSFDLTDGKGNVLETYKFLNCWDYKTPYGLLYGSGLNYPMSLPINSHYANGMYGFTSVCYKSNYRVRTQISSISGNYCGNGALYYANNLGGWDCFLIEGNVKKTDTYSKYTIENKWTAKTLERGTRTLVNTVDESWTLQTHLLTDEESKAIAEQIYGSNNIYYHDFATDRIVPVIITDTSIEYKTRANQKRKRFFHTINIKSTQPKQRI